MLGKIPQKIIPNGVFFIGDLHPKWTHFTGILDLLVGWLENLQNILPDGGCFIGDESHGTK